MMAEWPTFALYWYAPDGAAAGARSDFRPAADVLPVHAAGLAARHRLADDARRHRLRDRGLLHRRHRRHARSWGASDAGRRTTRPAPWRGLSIAFAALLLMLAARVYLGRFERLFEDHTIFAGVTYTDAHVTLTGMLVVAAALVVGAADRRSSTPWPRRGCAGWSPRSCPRSSATSWSSVIGWYVSSFIVKPNELVREQPYITHNIEMTRQAYGLDRIDAAPVSGRSRRRGARRRQQSGDAAEHPAVGLARAAGHAAPDSGNPHLLRLSRHRHRPL